MEFVVSRFGNDVDNPTGVIAILRIRAVGEDAKFRDGIEIGNDGGTHARNFLSSPSVHHEPVGPFSHSAHREVSGVQVSGNIRRRVRT